MSHRSHRLWFAFLLHRLSGLGLVFFLPLHFWLLAMAMTDREALASALAFTDHPLVKIAEFGLVFLLSVHLFGGIRLLVLEWVAPSSSRWTDVHKTLAASAVALAFGVAGLFLLRAV